MFKKVIKFVSAKCSEQFFCLLFQTLDVLSKQPLRPSRILNFKICLAPEDMLKEVNKIG